MSRNRERFSVSNTIVLMLVLLNGIILEWAYVGDDRIYWILIVTVPLLLIAIYNMRHRKNDGLPVSYAKREKVHISQLQ